ncbi:very short patch repair endonuclease [Pseudokineococcus basanitobsidens]|uniref:Very short patch repair endonuclease n=1 Tax=Pseudokineococcus basanitobsidens TaxID=1926649 RepID=A0ABU8RNF7_9ACTN
MTTTTTADGRPRSNARTPRSYTRTGAPAASTPGVRSRMQSQKARDTAPELAVRRLLHADGLRYRVDRAPLPGLRRRADVIFGPARVAVYIDGCFWHGCPEHGTRPRTNSDWWLRKLDANRARDADTDRRLTEAGWAVLRAWEHEDPRSVADRVGALVASTSRRPTTPRRAA